MAGTPTQYEDGEYTLGRRVGANPLEAPEAATLTGLTPWGRFVQIS